MNMNFSKTVLVTTLAFSVVACGSKHNTERRVGTGAAVAGLAGYVLSGGDTATTLSAAALGGVAGVAYDKHQDKKEDRKAQERAEREELQRLRSQSSY